MFGTLMELNDCVCGERRSGVSHGMEDRCSERAPLNVPTAKKDNRPSAAVYGRCTQLFHAFSFCHVKGDVVEDA